MNEYLAVVPYMENDGKQYIKFDKVSGDKSQGTGWNYAVFCSLHRATSEEVKGNSISLHSPVSLLLYLSNPLSVKDTDNNKIQKRRENKYMAEGWAFLQPLAWEHGWLPQLLLVHVPFSLSSQSIYCSSLTCILSTTALQNFSATSLYHLPGAVAYTSQLSLVLQHASLQTQLWETRLRRAESLWLTPVHIRRATSPFQGSQQPTNHLQIPEKIPSTLTWS